VLDLLTGIDDGVLKAGDVKDLLCTWSKACTRRLTAGATRTTRTSWPGAVGTELARPATVTADAFAKSLALVAERWRRWMLPDQYPYAAGNAKGLHEVGCHILRQGMPQEFSPPAADDAEALRSFAHQKDAYDRPPTGLMPNYHIPFHAMTPDETRAWMERNTGPKGGRYYHRCERCAPTP
jgi:hypothetical protein